MEPVVLVSFAAPHFIEALGEEGLTAHEIAYALGVDVKHVHEKIRRNSRIEEVQNWRVVVFTTSNESNGLDVETYALNTRAAKAFVARWNNNVGDAYLDFLFECEHLALEEAPRLKLRIQELEAQKGLLQLDAKKPHKNVGTVPYYSTKSTLFSDFDSSQGLHNYETRRVQRDSLREDELATQERIHCSVRLAGTTKELLKREAYEAAICAWEGQPSHVRGEMRKPQRRDFGLRM